MGDASTTAFLAGVLPLLIRGATLDPDGNVLTTELDGAQTRVRAGALANAMREADPSLWPKLAEAWCAAVLQQLRRPSPAVTPDRLRLLLAPRRPANPAQLVIRPLGDCLQLEMMADLADRRAWLGPSELAHLDLSPDDAWARALYNTERELATVTPRRHTIAEGFDVLAAARDACPWISAGLMSVPTSTGETMPYGTLVAVPRRSSVLFSPVRNAGVIGGAVVLHRLVTDMHRDAPDPCSPGIFWVLSDAIYPVDVDGERVSLHRALRGVVARLPTAL